MSSGAPERRAVHGLAEVGDGHVVGLSEGRGCLDLEVRGLDRERGQRARWRPRRRTRRRARTRGAPRSPTFFSAGDRGCSSLTWRREVAVRPSRGGLASEAASSVSTTGRSRRGSRPRRGGSGRRARESDTYLFFSVFRCQKRSTRNKPAHSASDAHLEELQLQQHGHRRAPPHRIVHPLRGRPRTRRRPLSVLQQVLPVWR